MSTTNPEIELPPEVAAALGRLDELVGAFEQHPDPTVQECALELLRCIDRVHRGGLRRLAELLRIAGLQQPAVADPEVRLLFELYELGEGGERARADAVLEGIRPTLESHGIRIEVVRAEAGVVTVRLAGPVRLGQASASALLPMIEQPLRDGMPDFVRVEIQGPEPPSPAGFVPLSNLERSTPP